MLAQLFIAVILGLVLGHWVFAYRGPHPLGGESAFGKDPCCPVTPTLEQAATVEIGVAGINAPLLPVSSAGATLELHVTGMTCQACANRVGAALRSVPGVNSADVTLATGIVLVSCTSSGQTLRSLLTAAVEEAGFGVRRLE